MYIIMSDIFCIENIWKRRFEYSWVLGMKGTSELTGNPIPDEKKIPITSQKEDDRKSITVGLLFIKSLR